MKLHLIGLHEIASYNVFTFQVNVIPQISVSLRTKKRGFFVARR